jgi:hypothetical protein
MRSVELEKIMKKLLLLITFFSILCTSCTNSDPALVGVWSNKKDGFSEVRIGLRHDGRGFFSTSVLTVPLRWSVTNKEIKMHIALPENYPYVFFKISKRNNDLIFIPILIENENEIIQDKITWGLFEKINKDEPDDIERQLEQQVKKEESPPNSKAETKKIFSIEELNNNFSNLFTKGEKLSTHKITGPSGGLLIIIGEQMGFNSIAITYSHAEGKETEGRQRFSSSRQKPKSGLKEIFYIDEEHQRKYENFLANNKIQLEKNYHIYQTLWGISSYTHICTAYTEDKDIARKTAEFITYNLLKNFEFPFEVTKYN